MAWKGSRVRFPSAPPYVSAQFAEVHGILLSGQIGGSCSEPSVPMFVCFCGALLPRLLTPEIHSLVLRRGGRGFNA